MHSAWYVSVISAAIVRVNSRLGLRIRDQNSSSMFDMGFHLYDVKQLQNNRTKTVLSITTCLQI